MGRRKIEMRIVKNKGTRQVTFSKRRNGVFKKANELATLCAAEIAIVVFSPGGKPYSYGNPSVNAVTERFLGRSNDQYYENANANAGLAARRRESRQRGKIEDQRAYLDRLTKALEAEKLRGQTLDENVKEICGVHKIKDLNDFDLDELKEYHKKFQELHDKIMNKVRDMEVSSTLMMLSKDKTPFDPEGLMEMMKRREE